MFPATSEVMSLLSVSILLTPLTYSGVHLTMFMHNGFQTNKILSSLSVGTVSNSGFHNSMLTDYIDTSKDFTAQAASF